MVLVRMRHDDVFERAVRNVLFHIRRRRIRARAGGTCVDEDIRIARLYVYGIAGVRVPQFHEVYLQIAADIDVASLFARKERVEEKSRDKPDEERNDAGEDRQPFRLSARHYAAPPSPSVPLSGSPFPTVTTRTS